MKKKASILTAIVLMISFAAGASAQEARKLRQLSDSPNIPQFEQDVTVRLRLVDVTAIDSSGNYVTDLRADEFKVFVNGKEMRIRTFDAYYPGATMSTGERGGGELAGVPRASMPERRIVLFFDQAYSSFRGLKNAKEAAMEFVRRNLSPGDRVMVVGYDLALKIYQPFTGDRERVAAAIDRVKFGFSNAPGGSSAYFRGENPHNIRIFLQALQKLALYLKSFRGRKTFVMLSEGYDERIARFTIPQYLKDTYEAFNNANSTIFTVDVRGIDAPGYSGSALVDINRRRGRHDTLSTFAVNTGGVFYRGSNKIEDLLLRVDTDISHYYVLGFYIEEEPDGRFREVKVQTTRPGVKLRYRNGYFAPKPFRKLNSDERAVQLEEGFNRNVPTSEIAARFAVNVFPRNDGSAVGTVAIQVPIEGEEAPEYEILGFVSGEDEELIDAFHKLIKFSSFPKGKIFRHVEPVKLRPGENLIRVVLRDNRDGRRAYQFLVARMPELGSGFYASTIAFGASSEGVVTAASAGVKSFKKRYKVPRQEVADPLAPLKREGISLGVSNVLDRSSSVQVIMRAVGMKEGRTGPQLAAVYRLRSADGESYDVVERDFRVFPVAGADAAIVVSTLDLSQIPAGDYVLTARLDDTIGKKSAGQRVEITLR